jgi:hypothetical protein
MLLEVIISLAWRSSAAKSMFQSNRNISVGIAASRLLKPFAS